MRYQSRPAFVLSFGLMSLALQGCAQKANEEPLEHTVRKVPSETPAATTEARPGKPAGTALRTKEEFERTLNQRIEELEVVISELETKVASHKGTVTADWTDRLLRLESKRKVAKAKLDEIRKSTGEAWEHLRNGAHKALEELEQSVQEAVKEL